MISSEALQHIAALAALGIALVALSARPAFSQAAPWDDRQTGVAIAMRDGKTLAADIILPEQPGAYPTILIQTPYSRKRIGAALPDADEAGALVDRERYAMVVVDWRGFFDSKPAMEGVRLPRRGRDGYDTVEWIARQPWSNGKVGTWGPSALGKIQFLTAQEQPPHLVCCVPVVASPGITYADYYENGVYREAHVKLLDRLGFGVQQMARTAVRSDKCQAGCPRGAILFSRWPVPLCAATRRSTDSPRRPSAQRASACRCCW